MPCTNKPRSAINCSELLGLDMHTRMFYLQDINGLGLNINIVAINRRETAFIATPNLVQNSLQVRRSLLLIYKHFQNAKYR